MCQLWQEKENSRAPARLEFYIDAHKNKSGTYKENSDSQEFVVNACFGYTNIILHVVWNLEF